MSEDFGDWSDRKRVEQDRATTRRTRADTAPKPDTSSYDWSSPSSGSYTSSGSYGGGGYSGLPGQLRRDRPDVPVDHSVHSGAPILYPVAFLVAFAGSGIAYGVLEVQFIVYTASGRGWLRPARS